MYHARVCAVRCPPSEGQKVSTHTVQPTLSYTLQLPPLTS